MRYIDQEVITVCKAQGSVKHRSFIFVYICLVSSSVDDQYQVYVEDSQQPCHEENKSSLFFCFLWKKTTLTKH